MQKKPSTKTEQGEYAENIIYQHEKKKKKKKKKKKNILKHTSSSCLKPRRRRLVRRGRTGDNETQVINFDSVQV